MVFNFDIRRATFVDDFGREVLNIGLYIRVGEFVINETLNVKHNREAIGTLIN